MQQPWLLHGSRPACTSAGICLVSGLTTVLLTCGWPKPQPGKTEGPAEMKNPHTNYPVYHLQFTHMNNTAAQC